jgi:hypothetical protein
MEPVSMQNLYNSNGKINWFGWIIFLATIALILYSLYQCYLEVKQMNKDEQVQAKKMMELEMNLREVRGDQYKSMNNETTNKNNNSR